MARYLDAALALALTSALVLTGCQKAPPAPIATNAATAPATAPTSDTADAADAKSFLDGLYGHYKTSQGNIFQPYDANAKEVFDPDTIALLKADQAALKGEVGDLDGDLLCNCQDFTSITATIAVQSATPTAAEATSDFLDTGMSDAKPQHVSFDLVKVNGAWRIHDIHTADTPSLRDMLTKEIAGLRKGGATNASDEAP